MMVGALVGVAAFQILTSQAYMPTYAKVFAQIVAGAFIASTIEKRDILHFQHIMKPTCIVVSGMLILNILMGIIIHYTGHLDLLTSFFCAVPGGMADTPIIAADVGANGGQVAVLQFARMVFGIGIMPSLILKFSRQKQKATISSAIAIEEEILEKHNSSMAMQTSHKNNTNFAITVIVAMLSGILGRILGVPVGALLFSLLGVILFNFFFNRAYLPIWVKRVAQVLSGAYIGSSFGIQDIYALKKLILPMILLLAGYGIACFVIGHLLHKTCHMDLKEAYLCATPAGASDIALIASDLGVQSTDLAALQIIRMLTAVTVFPLIILFLIHHIY